MPAARNVDTPPQSPTGVDAVSNNDIMSLPPTNIPWDESQIRSRFPGPSTTGGGAPVPDYNASLTSSYGRFAYQTCDGRDAIDYFNSLSHGFPMFQMGGVVGGNGLLIQPPSGFTYEDPYRNNRSFFLGAAMNYANVVAAAIGLAPGIGFCKSPPMQNNGCNGADSTRGTGSATPLYRDGVEMPDLRTAEGRNSYFCDQPAAQDGLGNRLNTDAV